MVKPTPTLAERACGALVGHAAGSRIGGTPNGPAGAEIWLASMLAEELLEPAVDLRRLALRWAGRAGDDAADLDVGTRAALATIEATGVPPTEPAAARAGNGHGPTLSRLLPIALATLHSPRNLVSATWHIAALMGPDPATAWAQVALNVAAARLLRGHGDFIPDVIEALRANGSPAELVDAVRLVPLQREVEAPQAGCLAAPMLQAALWFAYRERTLGSALAALATAASPCLAAPTLALLGARDGEAALAMAGMPVESSAEGLRTLARRLVGAPDSDGHSFQ